MKKIKINNDYFRNKNNKIIEFDKIIKTNSSIVCILNDIEYCKFNKINDFSIFEIEDGDWDTEENKDEIQVNTLAELTIEDKKKDVMIANLAETVANLTIQVNKIKGSAQ